MKTIDWKHLTFSYTECAKMVRCSFKNGQWGEVYVTSDFYISIHAAATALQYAQQAFEGLKAFRGVDGKVRIFRPEANDSVSAKLKILIPYFNAIRRL